MAITDALDTPVARSRTLPSRPRVGSAEALEAKKAAVFRELFDEFGPRVRHHLACFLDNPDEVDEIAAEVFVVAWRKLRPEKPLNLKWFMRTADNKLRDVTRSARSKRRALEALSRGIASRADSIHPLEALALRQAMTRLNARERQVVVLTYWDELAAGEVANILNCSQAAVWTTLSRARTKLRTQLETTEAR